MKDKFDYSLYLVTDRELMCTDTLEEAVEQAILGGCSMVQLREKTASSREFHQTALSVREITQRHGVPLIINDRADIALAVDAEGVHLGQSDLPTSTVRSMIGSDKLLGVSVSTAEEALLAEADGADYIGVGAMFSTYTKKDAEVVSFEELSRIRKAVELPIVVIGGISRKTAPHFQNTGIDGFAVVSDIIAQQNIQSAARELRVLFEKINSRDL